MEECTYRPPSEAFSLLLRVVRNCNWNKCRFCFMYKDAKFSRRSLEEILEDIDEYAVLYERLKEIAKHNGLGNDLVPLAYHYNIPWIMDNGPKTAFLGDSNAISHKTEVLIKTLDYLKEKFPSIERITSYGRSKNVLHKSLEELEQIKKAGLTRLHIGLESGDEFLLNYIKKGATPQDHIDAGQKIKDAGISLSEYVIMGLGGKKWYEQHAINTAKVLNAINPDFIRIRTLFIDENSAINDDRQSGDFEEADVETLLKEQLLLLQNLKVHSRFVSDHITNILNLEGDLGNPDIQQSMIKKIKELLSLPQQEQEKRLSRRRIAHL